MTALDIPPSLAQARPTSIFVVAIGLSGTAVMSATWHGHAHPGGQSLLHVALQAGLMTAAMMLPLAAGAVSVIEERTLRRRRKQAVTEHAAGFAVVWFLFGASTWLVVAPAAASFGKATLFAAASAFAIFWQLSYRRRALMEREAALGAAAVSGLRAAAGTVRAAAGEGIRCMKVCWPSMLAVMAAPNIAFVGAWLAVYFYEWLPGPNPHGRRRRLVPAVGYALVAFTALAPATPPPS